MTAHYGTVRYRDLDGRIYEPKPAVISGEVLEEAGAVTVHHDTGVRVIPRENVIHIEYPNEPEDRPDE